MIQLWSWPQEDAMQKEEKRKFFTSIGKFFLEREILCRATQCKYYCILDAAAIPFTISVITFFLSLVFPISVTQRVKNHLKSLNFEIFSQFRLSNLAGIFAFSNEMRLFWWFLTTVWIVQFFCKIILFKKTNKFMKSLRSFRRFLLDFFRLKNSENLGLTIAWPIEALQSERGS